MALAAKHIDSGSTVQPTRRRGGWLATIAAVSAIVAVGLFVGYLRMARSVPVNGDGGAFALQAWDVLHGNVLLHGWYLSDVSFLGTDLAGQAFVELFTGLTADAVHVSAALTYTLLVAVVIGAAWAGARGRAAVVRIAIAAAIMLAPAPGVGTITLLSSADHTGSAIPVLLTWLVVERHLRRRDAAGPWWRRWLGPVLIGGLLAWATISDPLAIYVADLPLALIFTIRVLTSLARRGRTGSRPGIGRDWRILLTAPIAMALTVGFESTMTALHGFQRAPTAVALGPIAGWWERFVTSLRGIATVFGAYLPDRHGALAIAVGVAHLCALAIVAGTLVALACRLWRARGVPDRLMVPTLVAVGAIINIAAYVVSTLPDDRMGCREIVAVLPFGAVLAARLLPGAEREPAAASAGVAGAAVAASPAAAAASAPGGGAAVAASPAAAAASAPGAAVAASPAAAMAGAPGLGRARATRLGTALLAALALGTVVVQGITTRAPVGNADGQVVADWLVAHGYRYGLGSYWYCSNVTLASGNRVAVRPISIGDNVTAYQWQSRSNWYDPARNDARFVVLDPREINATRVEQLAKQFGRPVIRQSLPKGLLILGYDHNLLPQLR